MGWVVSMRLLTDMLEFLFFPGLLFVAACGFLILRAEGRLLAAFYGVRGLRPRGMPLGEALKHLPSAGELTAAVLVMASMGLSGVLLVGARGDLFVLFLLFAAAEMLSLYLVAARGDEQALYVPLLFRTSLCRMTALLGIALSLSLRFPAAFSPGLDTLRGEGAPWAAQMWGGPGFAFITASLACAGLAYFLFLLGRPPLASRRGEGGAGGRGAVHPAMVEGPQRAAGFILCVVLFLGYPWEGWTGKLLWSAAALGVVAVVTLARAWLEGRGTVLARRLQEAAPLLALFSLAMAFSAVITNGTWGR